MKNLKKYRGTVVPMVSPTNKNQIIDKAAVARLVEHLVAGGVNPMIMGTNGEGNSVEPEQSVILAAEAAKAVAGRATLYAAVNGGGSTVEHIRRGNAYFDAGVDVVAALLPGYYKLNTKQIMNYYTMMADGIKGPIIIYNIPATTGMSIPMEAIKELSYHPNIVGLKDSERDEVRIKECCDFAEGRDDFAYFCGWGAYSAQSLLLGADGIVPSTGNMVPRMFTDLYEAALRGDAEEAMRLQKETDVIATVYQAGRSLGESLGGLKAMMSAIGFCEPEMFYPLTRLPDDELAEITRKTQELILNK